MKIFEKVKNLFTEEVEEEKEIKREVRKVEIPAPRVERREEPVVSDVKPAILEKPIIKEDKNLFFSDEEFEDLDYKEKEIKIEKKEEPKPYKGTKVTVQPKLEEKKVFKPTPIISPVYGVLDKNYKKEDIIPYTKPSKRFYQSDNITVDDVRKRAFSSLEDDIKNDLLNNDEPVEVVDDLNMFEEENSIEDSIDDEKTPKIDSDIEFNFDDETELLAKQLEDQKRKLDEINNIINDNSISNHKTVKNVDEYLYQDKTELKKENVVEQEENTNKNLDEAFIDTMDDLEEATMKAPEEKDNMSDSEIFDLIDSIYEKDDEIDE